MSAWSVGDRVRVNTSAVIRRLETGEIVAWHSYITDFALIRFDSDGGTDGVSVCYLQPEKTTEDESQSRHRRGGWSGPL